MHNTANIEAGEEWRKVDGHPLFEVSNLGRARSWKPWGSRPLPRLLSTDCPYPIINLAPGVRERLHVLILTAFVGPQPFPYALARHLDDDPTNNRVGNLAWGTHAENTEDAIRNGRLKWRRLDGETTAAIGRDLDAGGIPQREIAERHGVSRQTVGAIVADRKRAARRAA